MARRPQKAERPAAPDNLDDEALLEWERVCDELDDAKKLAATDRPMLVLYVETWAIYQSVMRHVRQHGAIVKWPNGTVGQSPFYKTSREAAAQLERLLLNLGLAPIVRDKVKQVRKSASVEELLNG